MVEGLNNTSFRNRRASLRHPPRGSIRVECRKGVLGLGQDIFQSLVDLSETGARMILRVTVEQGNEVEIIVEGFGIKSLKRLAEVKWVSPLEEGRCQVGVRFQKPLTYSQVQVLAKPR